MRCERDFHHAWLGLQPVRLLIETSLISCVLAYISASKVLLTWLPHQGSLCQTSTSVSLNIKLNMFAIFLRNNEYRIGSEGLALKVSHSRNPQAFAILPGRYPLTALVHPPGNIRMHHLLLQHPEYTTKLEYLTLNRKKFHLPSPLWYLHHSFAWFFLPCSPSQPSCSCWHTLVRWRSMYV